MRILVISTVVILAFAGAIVGTVTPISNDMEDAERHASASGAAAGSAKGTRDGLRAGRSKGTTEGVKAGRSTAYKPAYKRAYQKAYDAAFTKAKKAEQQRQAALATPRPGTPGSTVCVMYQDYVPGVGCVPPLGPGQTSLPGPNCPPGTRPVGTTGACA